MSKPFFSVVTLSLNSSKNIKDCLISLYSQKFNNFEHIIQDGCSNDGTIELINKHKTDKTFVISQKDSGLYDALNKAIKRCEGEYILLLHSDDCLYDENILQNLFEFITTNHYPKVIIAGVEIIGNNRKLKRRWLPSLPTMFKIDTGWMAPHPGIVIKKGLAKSMPPYDNNLKISSDYDFEISLFRKYYANTLLFNRLLTTMKQGGISNSGFRAKLNKTLEDIIVMRRNNINPIIGIIMKNLRKVNQLWNL